MTALTTTAPVDTAASRLRAVLLVDGVGTAALGAVAFAAAAPLAEHVGSTTALRAVGLLFVLIGGDMLLARRLDGRRLAAGATVLGALDLVWAAGTTAALPLLDTTPTGAALVLAVAAVCVAMGVTKLALARQLRG